MSRSGYSEDCDGWSLIMYRGAVASATKGKRGQALLKELLGAMDAMENKRLVAWELEKDGEVCALGALGKARGIDMSKLDPEYTEQIATTFGIAPSLAREIVYMNDEVVWRLEEPEARFTRMREWIASQILPDPPEGATG